MKNFNYFRNGQPITKDAFVKGVPENWENEVIDGCYSFGYYNAIEIEQ